MLHKETISPALAGVARALVIAPELKAFRIVGGTAVALHLGHRKSVDIDFFSNEKVNKQDVLRFLKKQFPGNEFFVTEHNILGEIDGVRVDLYDDWMVPFKRSAVVEDGLRLAAGKRSRIPLSRRRDGTLTKREIVPKRPQKYSHFVKFRNDSAYTS